MIDGLLADLRDEGADLDRLVGDLDDEHWHAATPAVGWTIAHQIGHLTWTDEVTLTAVNEPQRFALERGALTDDLTQAVDAGAAALAALGQDELMARWRTSRAAVLGALAAAPDGARIGWFGPPMSAASMATARLMETWAHGQDVADALGVRRRPAARLRHVAHLGVRTRDFAFGINGRAAPTEPFRIELTAPDGGLWEWGAPDADQRIVGDAEDFALVVTQRRPVDRTGLRAVGDDAAAWLDIRPGVRRAADPRDPW